MRRPFVAANWKMYKTAHEAIPYIIDFAPRVESFTDIDIVIAPPYLALPALAETITNKQIEIAAQNVHPEPQGAFTGEISLGMLQAFGVTRVIIGHSERRQLFGETDTDVNAKTRAAVAVGLTPIVCVGETLEERKLGRTLDVLDQQVTDGLSGLSTGDIADLVIAYEPVWAIGTGSNATPNQAQDVHRHIRQKLRLEFGNMAASCRIIYGGSVKPDNAASLSAQPDIDGALVGGASLDPISFAKIVADSRPAEL